MRHVDVCLGVALAGVVPSAQAAQTGVLRSISLGMLARGRRASLCVVLAALSSRASVDAQLPPQGLPQVQKQVDDFAAREAEKLALLAKVQVGTLNPEVDAAFRRWDEAVRLWLQEKGAGAAPLLAEGVMFDCFGRLQGVRTSLLRTEGPLGEFDELAALRPARAAKAFDAALRIDPHLIEARMRAARIRAATDARAALDLEHIASDQSGSPFSYLAAVSRAAVAHAHHDAETAIYWYERSLALNPRSTAATIGLSTLKPAAVLPFEALDSKDLYYTYPCRVVTADVSTALVERMRRVVLK
jgi:hypothetical protein